MFNPKAIKKLFDNKAQAERIQKEAEDLASPNNPKHLKAKLQLGLHKVDTTNVLPDLLDGFLKICEVVLLGEAHAKSAYAAMNASRFGTMKSNLIFAYYNKLQKSNNASEIQTTILGLCHEKGIGTPKNLKAARLYYAKAADKGYAPAQYLFGTYAESREVERTYYLRAIAQGYRPAREDIDLEYAPARQDVDFQYEDLQNSSEEDEDDSEFNNTEASSQNPRPRSRSLPPLIPLYHTLTPRPHISKNTFEDGSDSSPNDFPQRLRSISNTGIS